MELTPRRAVVAAAAFSHLLLLADCGARAPAPAAVPSATPAAEVRAARARSNAAIAARDADAVVALMAPDVVVTPGSGGPALVGPDSSRAAFARQFADTAFLGYVRTPDEIEASSYRPLAAERGRWVGRWRRADGVQELGGTYLAMWRRTDAGWQIRSELFVTLRCAGSRSCAP